MRPTKDLYARMQACLECHVGNSDREVNHDLIAAGHPRLNFEYSAFLANVPKHWNEQNDKSRYPDLEARAWVLGQLGSARAALELLAHRARLDTAPWPEFAEYDCFACHHELREPSWRQERGYNGLLPGSFPWGTWYYPMVPAAMSTSAPTSDANVVARLHELAKEMARPLPDRQQVAQQAQGAADQLSQWLVRARAGRYDNPAALRGLLARFAKENPKLAPANWDQAAQRYLALGAFYHALGDLHPGHRNQAVKASIQALVKPLEFPPGIDSPRTFDGRAFGERLQALQRQLGQGR
jgi:hypothetical protein